MGKMQVGKDRGLRSGASRWVSLSMVVVGTAVAIIGLILFMLPSNSSSFGWFAYAPLSSATFIPTGVFLSPLSQTGIVLFIVGVVLLAFGAGWAFGKRRATNPRRPSESGNLDS